MLCWQISNFWQVFCPCLKTASQFWPILTSFNAMKCRIFFDSEVFNHSLSCELISYHWRPTRRCKIHKRAKKWQKFEISLKKHFAIFLGIFACTMVFHTSKKFPNLADYMVKRIFYNIQLWPKNKPSKL